MWSAHGSLLSPSETNLTHCREYRWRPWGWPLRKLVAQHGLRILEASQRHRGGLLSSGLWQDKLMQWTLKDEAFKVQLFRFVDVFPRLNTPESVHEHLMDYLMQPGVKLPPFLGTAVSAGGLAKESFAAR